MKSLPRFLSLASLIALPVWAQTPGSTPASSPPNASANVVPPARFAPAYPFRYEPANVDDIRASLDRVLAYLEKASPSRIIDQATRQPVVDVSKLPASVGFERGEFQLVSYEWGVTYSGMLLAAEATGNARYRQFVDDRFLAITTVANHVQKNPEPTPAPTTDGQTSPRRYSPMRAVLSPRSLDDSGSMAAAMIRASRAGIHSSELRPFIDRYLDWISNQQFRFSDGTLARHRPHPNSLWLDDLYMSIPALTQMSLLTGESKYLDDAVVQYLQFAKRMFVPETNLFMHGWIQEMDPHPAFYWGRANGWAAVSAAELLSAIPENHPQRGAVLEQYRKHMRGLSAAQGGAGLWHQLLDRQDSYLETSASAMFVFAIARGINRGWLDEFAFGPAASLGWNAVAAQINERGEVEGTCVGTGMGFDPAFYYYRPVSVHAAHGYGPVLLAGAEMITLRAGKGSQALISDGAVQFRPSPSLR